MVGTDRPGSTAGRDCDGAAGVTMGDYVGELARTALVAVGLAIAASGWWLPGASPLLRSEGLRPAWLLVTGSVGLPFAAVGLTVPGEAPAPLVPDPGVDDAGRRRVVAGALASVVAAPAVYLVALDLFSPVHFASEWSTAGTALFGAGALAVGWGLVAVGLAGALAGPRTARRVEAAATATGDAVDRPAGWLRARPRNGAASLAAVGAVALFVGTVALLDPWPTPIEPGAEAFLVVHPLVLVTVGGVALAAALDRGAANGSTVSAADWSGTARHLVLAGGSLAAASAWLAATLTYLTADLAPILVYRVVLWILVPQAFLGAWLAFVGLSIRAGDLASLAARRVRSRGDEST